MARFVCIDRRSYPSAGRLALGAVLILMAGCAADEGRERRARRSVVAEPATAPPVRWEHADALERMRVVRDRVRSSHLIGEPEARVRVNEAASDYGRSGVVLPSGSLLVVSHDGGEGTLHFVMERAAPVAPAVAPSRWDYAVVDAGGWVVARGRIPTCVRCHEEAPADEVFGPAGLATPARDEEAAPTSPSTGARL